MSKVYDYNEAMELDEAADFTDRFIEELLLENHDLKQVNEGLREQIKFLMGNRAATPRQL